MARLAIAKGFLAEYAKLDKDVQGAVEAAIAKFAEHPHAGGTWRSRSTAGTTGSALSGWTASGAASCWRPMTGDTYCLITILPQDKANAYATSHRFSVNQALGVLEVRDEEAIQQLQPCPASRPPSPMTSGCSRMSATPTWPGSASTRRSCRWSGC